MARIGRIGKKGIALTVVVVLIVAGGATYFLTHKKTETIKVTSTRSASSEKAKKKSSDQKSGNDSTADNSTPPASDVPKSVPASTSTLQKPYGTFVSNHGPSPAPADEQSTCYTAPGATCYIEFTKGNSVQKLPTETADSTGSVTWNWKIKQAGLSAGSWTIKAVASLNGKTMTAQDDIPLEVQP